MWRSVGIVLFCASCLVEPGPATEPRSPSACAIKGKPPQNLCCAPRDCVPPITSCYLPVAACSDNICIYKIRDCGDRSCLDGQCIDSPLRFSVSGDPSVAFSDDWRDTIRFKATLKNVANKDVVVAAVDDATVAIKHLKFGNRSLAPHAHLIETDPAFGSNARAKYVTLRPGESTSFELLGLTKPNGPVASSVLDYGATERGTYIVAFQYHYLFSAGTAAFGAVISSDEVSFHVQ